ncbi:MAG: hypothetical protein RL653_3079 [Pseudomonadota bacterium]
MTVSRALLLVACCLASLPARADLFSPGDLSRPHASLSGITQCTKCHPAGNKLSQETCLSCHTELKAQLTAGQGFHGRVEAQNRNCERCHAEHAGENASLVNWGPRGEAGFDHRQAGWPLEGQHAKQKCAACHEPRRILSAPVKLLLEKRPHTRLGLGTRCADCHFDEHRGQEKQQCGACHDARGWKPAPGFSHDKTDFPLKGKHAKVKCVECHTAERDGVSHGFPAPVSESFLRLAPVAHASCTDCHEDPHEGRLGPKCTSCHNEEDWHHISNGAADRAFHQKTAFPLQGAHVDVACVACHGPFPGEKARFKGLPHDTCARCHVDAHEGQLGAPGSAPDCGVCHTVQAFTPVHFGMEDHARTRYPLEGAHRAVPCAHCHPPSAAVKARIPARLLQFLAARKRPAHFSHAALDLDKPLGECASCHRDVHAGQFEGQGCERCHAVTSFTEVAFDHGRDSRYPLEGKHAEVACDRCHASPGRGEAVRYKPLETACRACHEDTHVGQFGDKACETCHAVTGWKPSRFEHRPPFTAYLLEGRHVALSCPACHAEVQVAPGAKAVKYRPLPTACEGCHADHHRGAFEGFVP